MYTPTKSLLKIATIAAIPLALVVACAGSGEAKNQNKTSDKMNITQVDGPDKITQLNPLEKSTATVVVQDIPTIPQETALLADLSKSQKDIGDETPAITPTQHIMYFPSDIAKVDTLDYVALKQHADFLLENPNVILSVNGHADSQGSEKYNMSLSKKRAKEVSKILQQYGVPDAQVIQVAHGEIVPVEDISDWVTNRRVELEYRNPVTVSTR
ncbi:MAG: OmpA family protein [Thiohalomonadales bacterium]